MKGRINKLNIIWNSFQI